MNQFVRHKLGDAARAVRRPLSVGTCAALVLLASVNSQAQPGSHAERSPISSTPGASPIEAPSSDAAVFRLGNAARPFAWSTAIGDFDTDGKPDVAVADRIGRDANGYAYRIEFSMSGDADGGVTFASTHNAVTIRAVDVDADRDLDIVVGLPLSGRTVGVWLNDGHGHFTSADVSQWPTTLQAQQTVATGHSLDSLTPSEPPRRVGDGVPAFRVAAPLNARRGASSSRVHDLPSVLTSLRTAPRAPPIPSEAPFS
jgi:VCBS repeat protein